MKKKFYGIPFQKERVSKFLLIMRLSLILTFFIVLSGHASTYSQSSLISIDLKQSPLKDVFETIKKQTDYRFIYNNDLVDDNQKVDVSFTETTAEKVLESVCKETGLDYRIKKNMVLKYLI
ncbi:MAG: STN domain-containing protein [Bacteroidetes bacterium]|nr:STN domain-containing protein [Bacteroidota bacterium]